MKNLSFLDCEWIEVPYDVQKKETIKDAYDLDDITAKILSQKDLELGEIEDFLTPTLKKLLPDPSSFQDMDKVAEFLADVIEQKKTVGILADFDVDGATSAATIVRFLNHFGIATLIHIPDRFLEGYGPNLSALEGLTSRGADVILVLDCGTTNIDLFNEFSSVPVVIIDHHASPQILPNVFGLINPHRFDEVTEIKNLCTVGLCFLVIVALNRVLKQRGFYEAGNILEPNLMSFLDLVALGTVCDMMTLLGVNRAFVVQGLKVLNQQQNLGLKILAETAGVTKDLALYHLGFVLGPRINAGGRLGKSDLGVSLLTESLEPEVRSIASHLDHLNQERQVTEEGMLALAISKVEACMAEKPLIVIGEESFHQGIIGIIAGRLKDRYQKPSCVISWNDGVGKGSARSISNFHIGNLFHEAVDLKILEKGGGHAAAGGFTILKENLQRFEEFLEARFLETFGTEILTKKSYYHAILDINGITLDSVKGLERLGPFGMGNPTPKIKIPSVYISHSALLKGGHMRLRLTNKKGKYLNAMLFRSLNTPFEKLLSTSPDTALEFLGSLQVDDYDPSNIKPKLMIDDVRFSVL